tara:strand:- start:1866 stop:2720 length:855 start_codon:yes stop_codon:yes gene_type:complete
MSTNQNINNNHANAKEKAQQYSMQYGNSAERFGHKDYYAAKAGGASDQDILKQLDSNPDQLYSGNAKGAAGGLYEQIKSGSVPAQQQAANNTSNNTANSNNNAQGNNTEISNKQEQKINQDNDIDTTIKGNNNLVNNWQDNSIRQYGGDNRSFVYNSNGEGPDTPATMATLAGYYAPDDSHGAQAARLDRNQTLNADAQKRYQNTSHIALSAIKRAEQNSYINPKKLDQRIRAREQNSYDNAMLMNKNIFGDLSNMNFNWVGNNAEEKVEDPDIKGMANEYMNF